VERVQENAADFKVPLKRKYEVMVHGVLHYADTRTREKEELLMRSKEDEKLALFREQ
jgi:ssRNA-specific RNase YbeY (16S rRNA maturation enzyme)